MKMFVISRFDSKTFIFVFELNHRINIFSFNLKHKISANVYGISLFLILEIKAF